MGGSPSTIADYNMDRSKDAQLSIDAEEDPLGWMKRMNSQPTKSEPPRKSILLLLLRLFV